MKQISISRFFVVALAAVCVAVLTATIAAHALVRTLAGDVTLTGKVTCSQCLALGQHKGFTPWSWAMYKLSQGDNIVLVTSDQAYRLQANKEQLTKFIEEKATVSGRLDANTIVVTSITKPAKNK